MFFDPMYFVFVGPALILSLWAGYKTKSAFKKYSKVRVLSNLTGAQSAQVMLERAGIGDVEIVPIPGKLSDHYNPVTKQLALSHEVFGQSTVAAVGVACHEAGHAIQHARAYRPLWIRSILVKPASLGSKFGIWGMILGIIFSATGLVLVGAVLFSAALLFQLVTLPVEFDASNRAKKLAVEYGIVLPQEREGMDRVLNAAALTYVASAAMSLMTVLYYLMRAGLLGSRSD
jgi:Zn-dependent membrane protease YugP